MMSDGSLIVKEGTKVMQRVERFCRDRTSWRRKTPMHNKRSFMPYLHTYYWKKFLALTVYFSPHNYFIYSFNEMLF